MQKQKEVSRWKCFRVAEEANYFFLEGRPIGSFSTLCRAAPVQVPPLLSFSSIAIPGFFYPLVGHNDRRFVSLGNSNMKYQELLLAVLLCASFFISCNKNSSLVGPGNPPVWTQ